MCVAVLVPGNGSPSAWILDEEDVGKGREILSVNLCCDTKQFGVTVEAKRGVGELERTKENEGRFRRLVLRHFELANSDLMSTSGGLRSPERIPQRFRP